MTNGGGVHRRAKVLGLFPVTPRAVFEPRKVVYTSIP